MREITINFNAKKYFKNILLFSLILFFCQVSFAQQTLTINIDESTTAPTGLTSERNTHIQSLRDAPETERLNYIRTRNIAQRISVDGLEEITVSGESGSLSFKLWESDFDNLGARYWRGKTADGQSILSLYTHPVHTYLAGFIQSPSGFYEIQPLTERKSFVRKIDVARMEQTTCSVSDSDRPEISFESNRIDLCDENFECNAVVDILILIPPDVTAWFGTTFAGNPWGPIVFLANSVATFDMALQNSGVNGVDLRFHVDGFNFSYTNFPLPIPDVGALATEAANIRDFYHADIVVFFTSMNYNGVTGIVNAIGPGRNNAFLIAEVDFMIDPRWNLAHELGHLFAARHSRTYQNNCIVFPANDCIGDDTDVCSHGVRFGFGGIDRTVMSTMFGTNADPTSERALLFSSPDNFGDEDNNNVASIQAAACAIRSYNPSPFFEMNVSGPPVICDDEFFVALANVNEAADAYDGHPPYTFNWTTSAQSLITNGDIAEIYYNCPAGGCTYTVNCTVTSADGITTQSSTFFTIPDPDDCPERNAGGNYRLNTASTEWLYPNPVQNELRLIFNTLEEIPSTVQITDIKGKVVYAQNGNRQDNLNLDVTHLSTGLYFVKIQHNDFVGINKFIKK